MKCDPTLVVNSPPLEWSVLAHTLTDSDSRLGQILIAVHLAHFHAQIAAALRARKQQHAERLETFLTLRSEAAIRCKEAVLGVGAGVRDKSRTASTPLEKKDRPAWFTRPADRPITFDNALDKFVTGWYGKVYQTTYAQKGQGRHGRNNWCPVCKEYVAMSHDGPKGLACEKYIERRAQHEAAHLAWLRTQTNPVEMGNGVPASVFPNPKSQAKGILTLGRKRTIDLMVACIDQQTLAIERLFEQGHSLSYIKRELGVSPIRVVQQVKKYLDRLAKSCVEADEQSANRKPRKPKRHYVRHGAKEVITFVRQQDLNLAMET